MNAPRPDTIRLLPPLTVSEDEADARSGAGGRTRPPVIARPRSRFRRARPIIGESDEVATTTPPLGQRRPKRARRRRRRLRRVRADAPPPRDDDAKVRVLDSLIYGHGMSVAGLADNERFSFIRGDVRSDDDVARAMDGVTDVVLLAALVGDPVCKRNPELAPEVNVNGALRIAEAAADGSRASASSSPRPAATTACAYANDPARDRDRRAQAPLALRGEQGRGREEPARAGRSRGSPPP